MEKKLLIIIETVIIKLQQEVKNMECKIVERDEAIDIQQFMQDVTIDLLECKVMLNSIEITFVSKGLAKSLSDDIEEYEKIIMSKIDEVFTKEERITLLQNHQDVIDRYLVVEKELDDLTCLHMHMHRVETHANYLIYRGSLEDASDYRNFFANFVRTAGSEMFEYIPDKDRIVFFDEIRNISRVFGYKNKIDKVTTTFLKKGFVHEDSKDEFLHFFQQLRDGCENLRYDIHLVSKQGMDLWVEMRAGALKNHHNDAVAVYGSVKDINHQKKQETQTTQISRFILSMEELANFSWSINLTKDEIITSLKPSIHSGDCYSEILLESIRHCIDEQCQKPLAKFLDRDKIMNDFYENHISSNSYDYRHFLSDGQSLWSKFVYYLVEEEESKDLILNLYTMDINEDKLRELRQLRISQIDSLTGLSNKSVAKELVNKTIVKENIQNRGGAMMLFDIDHFRELNEVFGVSFGDQVLAKLAKRFISLFRENDVVCRIDGDMFMVVCANMNKQSVLNKADEICRLLSKEYKKDDTKIAFTLTSGVALIPEDGVDFETLFENADLALHEAKMKKKEI